MSADASISSLRLKFLWVAMAAYGTAWIAYVITGTQTLRGFFGDGALAFLIYLSDSFAFNKSSHWIHLFSVGLPREAQLALNGLGLQAALLLNIQDPLWLKYIYVFWQFAMPGFLYIALFIFLWRAGKISWAIFPLISWAILSVAPEWNAVSAARWGMPIFWMHFFLVMLSGPAWRLWPTIGAVTLGLLMWGGLYEGVMLQMMLCLGLGCLLWWREKNRIPFFYALMTVPGAARTLLFVRDGSTNLPNGFHGFALTNFYENHYFFFILLALGLIAFTASGKISPRRAIWLPLLLLLPAVNLLSTELPSAWQQMTMRYDYVALSVDLMAWAGLLRVLGKNPTAYAQPTALIALLTGTILWIAQIQQTYEWSACHTEFMIQKQQNRPLYDNYVAHSTCTWDWTTPWTELLFADQGRVDKWPVMSFWQDFAFIKKDSVPYLHTNNWTLTTPSAAVSQADLPLKTPLYDLTPLYERFGDHPITPHTQCIPPEQSGGYWRDYLLTLDDAKRRLMFVCPRHP